MNLKVVNDSLIIGTFKLSNDQNFCTAMSRYDALVELIDDSRYLKSTGYCKIISKPSVKAKRLRRVAQK